MPYEVRVSHICEDYTISDDHSEAWTRTIEKSSELTRILNRIAIATTQFPVVDFPEVKINWDSHNVQIRAIRGKLYYTELKSTNRRDLVVTPDEVIRLLEGQSVEQALRHDPDEDVYTRPLTGGSLGTKQFKTGLLTISMLVLAGSIYYSWKNLSHQVNLVEAPHFVPSMGQEGKLLRQYADVYISEFREGSTVIELTEEGLFTIYELWYSPKQETYNLVPKESYAVAAGLHRGEPALLAGEIHLLELKGDKITLHGVTYTRHGDRLSSLGEVLEGGY
ncbi:hypothetical protein DDZ13_06185 [Coraliomargarita sinensis]|uniref:Uncharacterized protein n=1 Tax=Coraliomargarita sinensis TaxID=2174842 RepID=A0A317ZGM3_9BACT|nr:hypothetical protein [Coraliomargarita sinensis]PXA04755.1 hypothetical protein DDZ13_06185 [Coraliomargarita sinensis]